jgi:hypothetical protein
MGEMYSRSASLNFCELEEDPVRDADLADFVKARRHIRSTVARVRHSPSQICG